MSKTMETIDWSEPEQAAKICAGNHREFDSFGWANRPEDDERYMIYNYRTRDSELIEESNASVIEETMKPFKNCWTERHGHWAVGWVECLVIKVYLKSGKLTKAFIKFCELMAQLEDYPLLDEEDHSRREYEATIENIKSEGSSLVMAEAADDWAKKVFSWLWDNDQRAVDSSDGRGGYPSSEQIRAALIDLDLIDPSEDDRWPIEDVKIGDVVFVKKPKDKTCFWKTEFDGTVVEIDQENGKLIVEDISHDRYEIRQGEFES